MHRSTTLNNKVILVTGSCGLVGSEVVRYFDSLGWRVVGIDNNMRRDFFGEDGDTSWQKRDLLSANLRYVHHDLDIRDRDSIARLVANVKPDLVVHAAAQPSHDLAAKRPFDDFEVNALGTLGLLEAVRQHAPECRFVFLSTNKVYGDRPNLIPLVEHATRWDYDDPAFAEGIDESMSIDQSQHSLFGASKVAADVMVQEYGRYFGIPTCCLRCGCLTGPTQSGVRLHGFLSYLVRCNLERREFVIEGYKGKQVRDIIHARDVARFIEAFFQHSSCGAVFNLGGGRDNSISIMEAFERVSNRSGIPMQYRYVDIPRRGDHNCYITNLSRAKQAMPHWGIMRTLDNILDELIEGWRLRLQLPSSQEPLSTR
jgi:CDP-paratose 2-epimerase